MRLTEPDLPAHSGNTLTQASCSAATGHNTTFSTNKNGDQRVNEGRRNEQLLPSNVILVDAQDALLGRLPVINLENYNQKYAHWRGSPPKIVDRHPNETAHQIIAETIVSQIRQAGIQ